MDTKADYIKKKGFDDQYYKDLIIDYLKKYNQATKKEIRDLLLSKLPEVLSEEQKENKIRNLIQNLRQNNVIKTSSENHQKNSWRLANLDD